MMVSALAVKSPNDCALTTVSLLSCLLAASRLDPTPATDSATDWWIRRKLESTFPKSASIVLIPSIDAFLARSASVIDVCANCDFRSANLPSAFAPICFALPILSTLAALIRSAIVPSFFVLAK